MLKYKTYLKLLSLMLVSIFGAALLYLYIFSKIYPLPILNRVSLDAKIKFIRDQIDINTVDTIIVGSSIGLNNVQGDVLEKTSIKCQSVLNISGFELRAAQVEQILELTTVFPNLKRVIYSAQFSDFSASAILEEYDPALIKKYLTNTLNYQDDISILFHSYRNIFSCIQRNWNWKKKYMSNNKFSYLGFDRMGSVPLHIYGRDIIKRRWENPHLEKQDMSSYLTLERRVKKAKKDNINFYFVMEPYREALVNKFEHVHRTMNFFEYNVTKILLDNDGKFLNLHKQLHLSDDYFSDRSHMNDKGSTVIAQAIGQFIDENE